MSHPMLRGVTRTNSMTSSISTTRRAGNLVTDSIGETAIYGGSIAVSEQGRFASVGGSVGYGFTVP